MEIITTNENKKIENMIYEIRGKQVMLDSDLANLYQCSNGTKSINLAVKRHINRFPERFMFQLTNGELNSLRFQTETTNQQWSQTRTANSKMSRSLPYVFTEQGIAMLATIIRTPVAEEISIAIMDAFVAMRHYISNNLLEQKYYNDMVVKHDSEIKVLQNTFNNFKTINNHIFFEGQIYDAYSLLLDIFETSKESIIIIDNYANKKLLDLLSKTKKNVIVYSKNINDDLINKYKKQYDNVELKESNSFHDRFIIIDNKYLYHSGASFKELGNKCFALNKIENEEWLKEVLEKIK